MRELLIGCGASRVKQIGITSRDWANLTTLDINPRHEPDVVHDLEKLPYPFEDAQFDEIHAYEVLEHTGAQGDWRFFGQWSEFYRILKPNGTFHGTVPLPTSLWAWGDPSHTRVLPLQAFNFLSQAFYAEAGESTTSDFRGVWKGDFVLIHASEVPERQAFILRKL